MSEFDHDSAAVVAADVDVDDIDVEKERVDAPDDRWWDDLKRNEPEGDEVAEAVSGKQAEEPGGPVQAKIGVDDTPFDADAYEFDPSVVVNRQDYSEFAQLARECNLSESTARKLLAFETGRQQRQVYQHNGLGRTWVRELRNDPEYGGAQFESTVRSAKAALTRFDEDNAVRDLLNQTGYGNNPGIVKMLARVHEALADDHVTASRGGGVKRERTLAQRMWPEYDKEDNNYF